MPDTTQQRVLLMTEDEFLAISHLSLGMWIRNNWRLWQGGELANFFKSKGVFHPDDMSGIILCSFYRYLHGQDMNVDEQVAHYQEYWRETHEYIYRLENDTAFAMQEKIKHENMVREKNEKLKLEFPIGTQVKAWACYSQIIGEIVEWRSIISKNGKLGSQKGPDIEIEYLEAKVRILEFMDIKKKKRIERCNRMINSELWLNINSIKKIE